jgi:hypothetical protein
MVHSDGDSCPFNMNQVMVVLKENSYCRTHPSLITKKAPNIVKIVQENIANTSHLLKL